MRRPALTKLAGFGVASGFVLAGGWWVLHRPTPTAPAVPAPPASCASAASPSTDEARPDSTKAADRLAGRSLQLPTGAPPGLSCRDARRVVTQARLHLAADPERIDARALADAAVDWLDPHGLWSASPDAPLAAFLHRHERELVRELEAPIGRGTCRIAEEAGALMANWIVSLSGFFEEAERHAEAQPLVDAFRLASQPAFEDRVVARPARELARELGRTIGVVSRSFGDPVVPFCRAAKDRFIPALSPGAWSRAVLAAALRAYLPQIDPHGGWAPLDEETSLYEVDLAALPPPRLWDRMERTALGVRVNAGMASPLEPRDLVLQVASVPTAGLSVEQVEQLAIFDDVEPTPPRSIVLLREGERSARTIDVPVPAESDKPGEEGG